MRRLALAVILAFVIACALSPLVEAKGEGKGGGSKGGGKSGGSKGGGSKGGSKKDAGKDKPAKGPEPEETPPANATDEAPPAEANASETPAEPAPETGPPHETTDPEGGKAARASADGKGKPEPTGAEDKGKPDATGPPEDKGKPDEKGPPDDKGKPDKEGKDKGKPDKEAKGKGDERSANGRGGGEPLEATSVRGGSAESGPRVRAERASEALLVRAEHVPDDRPTVLVLVHPDGTEEVIARNSNEARWNATGAKSGPYRAEMREERADGTTVTLASTRILVESPRASAPMAVAAVATGAVVTASAGAVAARGIDALTLLKQSALDASGELAEDKARTRTSRRTWLARLPALALVTIAALLLAVFRSYAAEPGFGSSSPDGSDASQDGWGGFLATLPIVGLAVLLFTLADYGAEWLLARATGTLARFRLWGPGAVSLALSSLILRAPFGYPGYMDEADRHGEASKKGMRALAFLAAGVALALPFVVLGLAWRWDFAEHGISTALMMTLAASMPFAPMPGRDLWAWRKWAWGLAFAVALALHMLWQLALLPLAALEAAALTSLGLFVVGYARLRREKLARDEAATAAQA